MTTHAQPTWHERQEFARQAIAAHNGTPARPVVHSADPDLHQVLTALNARLDLTGTGIIVTCRDTGHTITQLDVFEWAKQALLPHVEIKPVTPAKRRRTKARA